jgi:hypothetical protein
MELAIIVTETMNNASITVGDLIQITLLLIAIVGIFVSFSKTSNARAKQEGIQEEVNKNNSTKISKNSKDLEAHKIHDRNVEDMQTGKLDTITKDVSDIKGDIKSILAKIERK